MPVSSPTHVVTISVWDTHRAESVVDQFWVSAGPFDDAGELGLNLSIALEDAVDALELVDTRRSKHAGRSARWEQLTLL